MAARNEIKPLTIRADQRDGLDGHWERTFPVVGGQYYRFRALRHLDKIPVPRRSAVVRVLWRDAQGHPVQRDAPGAHSFGGSEPPLAEPDYPNDDCTNHAGWTEVAGVYRAPAKAAKAIVELHLRWAPRAKVEWSEVSLTETAPPEPRKVRLAAIHYRPHNGTSAMDSCRQFAPLVAEAARQKADLVVLPETLTATGNGLSYEGVAEPIPGPASDYFAGLARQHGLYLVVGLVEREGRLMAFRRSLMGISQLQAASELTAETRSTQRFWHLVFSLRPSRLCG